MRCPFVDLSLSLLPSPHPIITPGIELVIAALACFLEMSALHHAEEGCRVDQPPPQLPPSHGSRMRVEPSFADLSLLFCVFVSMSIIHSIMSTPQDAIDQNIEMWKVKKLIKGLEAARGYVLGFCHPTLWILPFLGHNPTNSHPHTTTIEHFSPPLSLNPSNTNPLALVLAMPSQTTTVSLTPDSILSLSLSLSCLS